MQILLSWILQQQPVQPVSCTPALKGLLPSPGCWGGGCRVLQQQLCCPHLAGTGLRQCGNSPAPTYVLWVFCALMQWKNPPVLPQAANRGRSCLNTSRRSALVTPWVLFVSHQCTTLFWRFILDGRRSCSSSTVGFPWFCLVFPGFSPGTHPCSSLSPPWAHREPEESSAGPAPVGCPRGTAPLGCQLEKNLETGSISKKLWFFNLLSAWFSDFLKQSQQWKAFSE